MNTDKLKKLLFQSLAGSICMVVVGVILLSNPDFGSAAVGLVVGWGLIIAGGIGLVLNLRTLPVTDLGAALISSLSLLFGMYLVKNPLSLASILGIGLGIYLIVQGISYLKEAHALRSIGVGGQASVLLGCVMLVFGIVLLAAPLAASQLVMTIAGVLLIVCGGAGLVVRIRNAKRLIPGNTKPKVIDADE